MYRSKKGVCGYRGSHMASSPSHKFGQLIGNCIEEIFLPYLEDIAQQFDLYLDHKSKNRSARKGKKVSWSDNKKNRHDLDFVLEHGGTNKERGMPVAFIECAWRRYTKHSRNKAQEIQGALLPLSDAYGHHNPFLGVILAGEFTDSAIEQLRSHNFCVLYLPYEKIVKAFKTAAIDIQFDEKTSDRELIKRLPDVEKKLKHSHNKIRKALVDLSQKEVDLFFGELAQRFERKLLRIVILEIFGREHPFQSVDEAIVFLKNACKTSSCTSLIRHEIQLNFSNGDEIRAVFIKKADAIDYLLQYVT